MIEELDWPYGDIPRPNQMGNKINELIEVVNALASGRTPLSDEPQGGDDAE